MRISISRRFDWTLFGIVLILGVLGVVLVASALSGNEVYQDWPWRQAAFLGFGIILVFVAAALDYRLLTTLAYPIYVFFLIVLLVLKVIGTVDGKLVYNLYNPPMPSPAAMRPFERKIRSLALGYVLPATATLSVTPGKKVISIVWPCADVVV